jgi:hypothetical protein
MTRFVEVVAHAGAGEIRALIMLEKIGNNLCIGIANAAIEIGVQ